jgi:hypothetical protein
MQVVRSQKYSFKDKLTFYSYSFLPLLAHSILFEDVFVRFEPLILLPSLFVVLAIYKNRSYVFSFIRYTYQNIVSYY